MRGGTGYCEKRRGRNVDDIEISQLGIGPIERRIGEGIDRSWAIVPAWFM